MLARIEMLGGRYAEAITLWTELSKEKDGDEVRNNLIWSQLMNDRLDADSERNAFEMVNASQVSTAALHTAAMVLLERGRLVDAAAYASQRQARHGTEVDDAQWLFRARLLQLLGFEEEALAAYAKVGNDDNDLVALRKRWKGKR